MTKLNTLIYTLVILFLTLSLYICVVHENSIVNYYGLPSIININLIYSLLFIGLKFFSICLLFRMNYAKSSLFITLVYLFFAIFFEYPDRFYTSERGVDEGLLASFILGMLVSIFSIGYCLILFMHKKRL